jgi:hypothetical protein
MPPSRCSGWIGPINRSSSIWISAGPSNGASLSRIVRLKMCPPFTHTISPGPNSPVANNPRPCIGLLRTVVLGERYESGANSTFLLVYADARRPVLTLAFEIALSRHDEYRISTPEVASRSVSRAAPGHHRLALELIAQRDTGRLSRGLSSLALLAVSALPPIGVESLTSARMDLRNPD